MSDAEPPRRSPPNLTRVQVYLYAVLALIVGVVLANVLREPVVDDESLVLFAAAGVVFGGVLAAVAVALVVRWIRRLSPERHYRITRLHTIALTGALVALLTVATVSPSLLGVQPQPTDGFAGSGFWVPSNVTAALPVAAALTTLLALGIAYRRLNRR